MKILLVTPPLTQLNTPYPATIYLTGFLRQNGIDAGQMDLGIELINKLFTRSNLSEIFQIATTLPKLSSQHKKLLNQADS